MDSYEIFPAKGMPSEIVARFGGLGRITFEFNEGGELIHEHEEIEDISDHRSANEVFGAGRVENAREAVIKYYREHHEQQMPQPPLFYKPGEQRDLFA